MHFDGNSNLHPKAFAASAGKKTPHSFNNENTCFLTVIINVKLKMSIWCNANKLGKLHKESERIFLHVKRAPEFGSSLDLAAIEQILVVLRQ